MIANIHTHTVRCGHAQGDERAYIERAIEGGFRILGFSDHTPYFFTGTDYVSSIRMAPQELDEYAETVQHLKKEYASDIEIHLGVEAEYYPKFFPRLVDELRARNVEYMILGQHMLGNEIGEFYCGRATTDSEKLDRYIGQCLDAMDTGLFTYLAHPDLIHFVGEKKEYERQIRKLCTCAREKGLPLEMNLLGLREGRHYPRDFFWQIAAEEGCTAVLGSDAHTPADVWAPETEKAARKKLTDLGMALQEVPTLVKL